MRFKVLVDTNILLSGSIYSVSEIASLKFKHQFYERSIGLIDLLRENIRKRVGIITQFIENEAKTTLRTAILDEVEQVKDIKDRETIFYNFSILLNSCENRLRNILGYFIREPVDPIECEKYLASVSATYDMLHDRAEQVPGVEDLMKQVDKRFRKPARSIYKEQRRSGYFQLLNMLRKPIEDNDKRILAEAIFLHNLYKQVEGGNIAFYLASCDYHFSPYRRGGIVSSQISSQIEKDFGILCETPEEITTYLKGKL